MGIIYILITQTRQDLNVWSLSLLKVATSRSYNLSVVYRGIVGIRDFFNEHLFYHLGTSVLHLFLKKSMNINMQLFTV